MRDLLQIPNLAATVYAGESGLDNSISSAHVIDVERPWEWAEAGDLVMTANENLPEGAADQASYLTRLAEAEASGVVVGAAKHPPRFFQSVAATADNLRLPILLIADSVPFVQVSRAVSEANRSSSFSPTTEISRIYERLRHTLKQGASASEIISAMEQEIQCGLVVVSTESDAPIVSGAFGASGSVVEAALHAWSLQRTSPRGLLRLKEKRPVLMLESPTRCPTALIVAPFLDQVPSYSVLQHVAAIVALGVDRQCASREETLESSGVLLSQLIAGNTVLMENDARLGRYGLPGGPFVLLAIEAAHSQWGTSLAQLRPEQAPGLVSSWSSMESLIMCTKVNCALWLTWLADKATVGVSGSFEWDGDVSAAAYESRWALERAKRTGVAILKYEEASAFVGPRSVADARALVKRVLRPVLAYDNEHGADLIPSLKSFLGRNRSWKYAAQELYIHKQTLVYRIERVEELTGRSLKNTADVAELWLALEALDDLQPCGEDRGSEVTTLRLALEPSH